MRKRIKKTQSGILKLIEKELKIVTKNHYRNTWMAVGMAVFGIPFGTSLGNMELIGIGLPIGMAIGIAIDSDMDIKAFEAGIQLDLEIKY